MDLTALFSKAPAALLAAGLFALVGAGCSDDPEPGDDDDDDTTCEGDDCNAGTTEVDTALGAYHLVVTAEPWPPVSGEAELEIVVTLKSDGSTVDGATVTVEGWMPAHGHGLSSPATVEAAGSGVYNASYAYSMPGLWEMTIKVVGSGGTDDATIEYDVE